MMIDLMDKGWVYNPKTQSFGGVSEQEDAVFGVQELQLVEPLILGKRDPWGEGVPEQPKSKVSYFVLDTPKENIRNLRVMRILRGQSQGWAFRQFIWSRLMLCTAATV